MEGVGDSYIIHTSHTGPVGKDCITFPLNTGLWEGDSWNGNRELLPTMGNRSWRSKSPWRYYISLSKGDSHCPIVFPSRQPIVLLCFPLHYHCPIVFLSKTKSIVLLSSPSQPLSYCFLYTTIVLLFSSQTTFVLGFFLTRQPLSYCFLPLDNHCLGLLFQTTIVLLFYRTLFWTSFYKQVIDQLTGLQYIVLWHCSSPLYYCLG
jgi:hypothetical protein